MWYHISVQGNGSQIIFWQTEDILHAIDLLAVYSHLHKVEVLAYQFLSNHYHLIVKCENPSKFMQGYRISYSQYFNSKYCSSGAVGRLRFARGRIIEHGKLEDRLIYVLRNSVHHKIFEHPYMDNYNSAKFYFLEERNIIEPKNLYPVGGEKFLKHNKYCIPTNYLINPAGHIYPRSFLKYDEVEKLFGPYANFITKISAPTEKEISANQGRIPKPRTASINDLQISEKVLQIIKPKSWESLSIAEVLALCHKLQREHPISIRQLSRVFGIPESTMRRRLKSG